MPSRDNIPALCRKRIALLCQSSAAAYLASAEDRVIQIVQTNLNNGRFERFAASRSRRVPLTLVDYIDIVLLHVAEEHRRVDALEKGDATEWDRLCNLLARRAYRMVQHFRNVVDMPAAALDFANEACLIIFDECYPFDVSFDAWASTILKNLILTRYTRGTDIMDRTGIESLDAPVFIADEYAGNTLGELFADKQSLAPFEKIENQTLLLNAIAQLQSPVQRQVVKDTYLRELDDAQIAQRLGKSKQAIYNLRHRALLRLRRILTHQIPPQEKPEKNIRGSGALRGESKKGG